MGPFRGGRGNPRGGRGGGGRGRGGGGARGGGRFNREPEGPPDTIVEIGSYSHPCESQLVCKATNEMVPYFNAGIFLENKKQIGKVDEILGPLKQYWFSVTLLENMNPSSFKNNEKLFVDPNKLLPLSRFLPKPPGIKPAGGGGGGRKGGRGGSGKGGFQSGGRGRGGVGSNARGYRGGSTNNARGNRGGGNFKGRGGGGGFRGGRGRGN